MPRKRQPARKDATSAGSELCNLLERSQNTGAILMEQSLMMRSLFALLAPFVRSNSPRYPLARKIVSATHRVATNKTIVSWNIDSIRAGIIDDKGSGGKEWDNPSKHTGARRVMRSSPMGRLISENSPDIICLQETKLQDKHVEVFDIEGYHTFWSSSTIQKGYSGVSVWSKEMPTKVTYKLPGVDPILQNEGRIITAYYPDFALVNTYVPNTLRAGTKPRGSWSKVKDGARRKAEYEKYMGMRQGWDAAVLAHLEALKKEVGDVVWCGDLNVARGLMDVHNGEMTREKLVAERAGKNAPARIKDLSARLRGAEADFDYGGGAGLRLEERNGIETILDNGFYDAYRTLYPDKYGFTYWDRTKSHFRGANNGWRIDYFILTPGLMPCVESMKVLKEIGERTIPVKRAGIQTKQTAVVGPSDHAPLLIKFF